jgi:hypothetical protein
MVITSPSPLAMMVMGGVIAAGDGAAIRCQGGLG